MKPMVRMAANGFSQPLIVDFRATDFQLGVAGILSSNGSLTWGVQHTLDDPGPEGTRLVSYSQIGTAITVTDLTTLYGVQGHGLSVADSVYLRGIANTPDGNYQIATVPSQNSFTVTSAVSQTSAGINASYNPFRWLPHVSLTGLTVRQDGNYAFPVRAVRLAVSSYVAGYIDLIVLQGFGL